MRNAPRGKILTVRLAQEEDRLLAEASRTSGESRSSLVREAVSQYCAAKLRKSRRTAYEAIAPKIGCARSGRGDLSARSHELFREALLAKRRKNSR